MKNSLELFDYRKRYFVNFTILFASKLSNDLVSPKIYVLDLSLIRGNDDNEAINTA